MKRPHFKSVRINEPLEKVWEVCAKDFEFIERWDANVKSSRSSGIDHKNAPVEGRVCKLYNGSEIVESIVDFDETNTQLSYNITKGLPGFIVSGNNNWSLEAVDLKSTKLTMKTTMIVSGFLGSIMQFPMKSQIGKMLGNVQEELKHFVETGKPHPRKQKKNKK